MCVLPPHQITQSDGFISILTVSNSLTSILQRNQALPGKMSEKYEEEEPSKIYGEFSPSFPFKFKFFRGFKTLFPPQKVPSTPYMPVVGNTESEILHSQQGIVLPSSRRTSSCPFEGSIWFKGFFSLQTKVRPSPHQTNT